MAGARRMQIAAGPSRPARGAARPAGMPRPVDPPPAGRPSRGEAEYPLRRVLSDEGDADPAAVGLTDGELLRLHRWMVTGRELDERMVLLHRQGRIGFYVGAVGEEATIVGTAAAMEAGDWLFPSYREHVAALMRGLPLATFVCNLLGNAGDLLRGRQMPCHESWRPGRFTSVSAPIATQLPHAVGAAWAARIRGDDMVALVWFGEGATSAGDFHAALNMAGVRKIPVVFACRNNGWAISTPRELQTASETIAQKAVAYGIHGERVDGNDLLAVFEATRRARARAAAGEGPTLLECVTYRLGPHTTSDDPRAYRSEAEVAPWRARDPILRLRRLLERRGLLTAAAADGQLEEVRAEIRDAVRVAEAQPAAPPVESMFDDVYAQRTWVQEEQRAGVLGDPPPSR